MCDRKLIVFCMLLGFYHQAKAAEPRPIPIDRTFEVLEPGDAEDEQRESMARAASLLGETEFHFAGIDIDSHRLSKLASKSPSEPFVRVVREDFSLPVDLEDFLYFLDDLLAAARRGRTIDKAWISFGRARIAGILLHPHDIFYKNRARLFGKVTKHLSIDKPELPSEPPPPAKDGAPPGPGWYSRYKNPEGEKAMLENLAKRNQSLAERTRSLLKQLREQDCLVELHATVRRRERGYLMWGSFVLSRAKGKADFKKKVRMLERVNRSWGLNVPIDWEHPDGWQAAVEGARRMKDIYGVGYATRRGAMRSKHYDARAVDLTAMGLPRKLRLAAPDGKEKVFDLSAAHESRDINLTPGLINWIERHFGLRKTRSDYPHWNDARKD